MLGHRERQRLFRRRQFQVQAQGGGVGGFAVGGGGITALCWEAEGESLMLAFGDLLTIAKPLEGCNRMQGTREGDLNNEVEFNSWKAHEGGVTSADWASTASRLILSTGCDCRCCIWSPRGVLVQCIATNHLCTTPRPWFGNKGVERRQSLPFSDSRTQNSPTAVAWKPSGDMFIVAVSNALALCNVKGELLSSVPLPQGAFITDAICFTRTIHTCSLHALGANRGMTYCEFLS